MIKSVLSSPLEHPQVDACPVKDMAALTEGQGLRKRHDLLAKNTHLGVRPRHRLPRGLLKFQVRLLTNVLF